MQAAERTRVVQRVRAAGLAGDDVVGHHGRAAAARNGADAAVALERLAAQLPPLGREVIGVGLFRRQPDDCGPREGKPRRKHPNHRVATQAIRSVRAPSGFDVGVFALGGEEGIDRFGRVEHLVGHRLGPFAFDLRGARSSAIAGGIIGRDRKSSPINAAFSTYL